MSLRVRIGLLVLFCLVAVGVQLESVAAQADGVTAVPEITGVTIRNLSNTAPSSVDPFLVTDRRQNVHLFWSEDVGGRAAVGGSTAGNTIMYTRWDGVNWTPPIDIQLTPLDGIEGATELPKAWQPDAVVDDYGRVHLIWLGQHPEKLFYTSAPADSANSAANWTEIVTLDENLTGTTYSLDIEFEAPNILHVVYARINWEEQYAGSQPRTLTYISSPDGGVTWNNPVDIALAPDLERGFSNVRLLATPQGHLFASYTEWDQSGNGQIAYVVRSLDGGRTWDRPVKLAERSGIEYERDWIQLAWLEDDSLVATIEGGFRAYRLFMYSDDAGKTWDGPYDQFYWLIGENGFVEFARDGAENLHLFIAQRLREGTVGRAGGLGLWHSMWLGGDQWSETQLVGGLNNMVNPRVVIARGNQIVASWYDFQVGEILVLNATLAGVPEIAPQAWLVGPDTAVDASSAEGTLLAGTTEETMTTAVDQSSFAWQNQPVIQPNTLNIPVFLGMMTASILIGALILVRWQSTRRNS